MYKKILVPTDGSSLSEQAAATAVALARVHGSALVTISVAQPFPSMVAEAAVITDAAMETALLMKQAQENVDKVAQLAAQAGVPCTTLTAMSYVLHEAIINAASANGCDLICMASHGRRGISKLLAGSVTQNILLYSTIPVLVLRPAVAS
jgi:nucleotide-binding universal stress UspA family protein